MKLEPPQVHLDEIGKYAAGFIYTHKDSMQFLLQIS